MRTISILTATLLFAVPATAQQGGPQEPGRFRPNPNARRQPPSTTGQRPRNQHGPIDQGPGSAGRQRGDRPGGRGFGPPSSPDQMLERMSAMLASRLELNDEQQAQFDEIVAAYKESLAVDSESDPASLFEQMRAAREAGDYAQVEALREQLRAGFRKMGETMESMVEEIEPILDDQQVERLHEIQQRMEQRRQNNPRERMRRIVGEMREALQLDESQNEQFDAAIESLRDHGRQMGEKFREMGELMRQAREAEQAGDTEKAEQLRTQAQQMRPDPSAAIEAFFKQIEPILNEDQLAIMDKYREQAMQRAGGDRRRGRSLDVREVLRAAKRLDLTEDQKDQLREIESEAGRARRQMSREELAALAEATRSEIAGMLDEAQRAEFERLLAGERRPRERARNQRRPGGDRPGKARRPGQRQRPGEPAAPGQPGGNGP